MVYIFHSLPTYAIPALRSVIISSTTAEFHPKRKKLKWYQKKK